MADRYQSDNPAVDEESESYNEWLIALALLLLAGDITREDYEAQMIYEAGRRTLTAVTLGSGIIAYNDMLPFLTEQKNVIRDSSQSIAAAIASGKYADTDETDGAGLRALVARLTLWTTAIIGRSYSQGMVNRPPSPVVVGDVVEIKEPVYRWKLGATEHCTDCFKFADFAPMTAAEWARYPQPQSPDLECGGWHCQCELVEVFDE